MKNISGEECRVQRMSIGMNLTAFAALSQITVPLICKFERGVLPLSVRSMARAMDTLSDLLEIQSQHPGVALNFNYLPWVRQTILENKTRRARQRARSATSGAQAAAR